MRAELKKTDLGVLPTNWREIPLGKIASEIGDGIHSTPDYSSDGEYCFINGNNLKDGKIRIFEDTKRVSLSEFRKHSKPLSDRTILMSINGTIGNIGLYCGEKIVLGKSAAYLNVGDSCSKMFLYQALQTQVVKRQFSDGLTGTTIKNLGLNTIRHTKIPLPPTKAEQDVIAESLNDVDTLIESLEQLITKKRNLKQSVMQELLTGKRRLPGFSGDWSTKSMGDLFSFSGGLSASRDQLSTSGHCYLHYGDIHGASKTYVDVQAEGHEIPKLNVSLGAVSPHSLLKNGDVVFVDASEDDEGTSKHVVIHNESDTPFISGLHTIVAKSKTSDLDILYRRYCFQTNAVKDQFRFYAVGTKVSGISKTNIAKIIIQVPPKYEQTAVAELLCDIDTEMTLLETKLTKTKQIKQGMMQELLTGRIRLV